MIPKKQNNILYENYNEKRVRGKYLCMMKRCNLPTWHVISRVGFKNNLQSVGYTRPTKSDKKVDFFRDAGGILLHPDHLSLQLSTGLAFLAMTSKSNWASFT